ncbi:Sphingolipid delta4-desaturase [Theobroma cacao]|nr:Sphingolipid delta4-desaturase [Theobroma cacao]
MNPKTKKNKHLVLRKDRMRRRRETDKWFIKKEMRRGERREEEKEEIVTANNFFWSYADKPHALRRRQILFQYPQIKELFGPNPLAFLKISVLRHNLALSTLVYNRWLRTFANLSIGVPNSVTFQNYHLEHHRFQWVNGIDMDVPSYTEAHLMTNPYGSSSNSFSMSSALYFSNQNPLIALYATLVNFWGWKPFAYLILSTFVEGGMHPMADHFISEHYIFEPNQETYSYYGPLTLLT